MIYIGIIRNADALVNGKYSCICDLKKRRRGYRTSSPALEIFLDDAEITGDDALRRVGVFKKVQQQVGHFRPNFAQHRAAGIAVVASRAAGAVAAEAGGKNVVGSDGLSVHAEFCHALADGSGAIKDIVHARVVVVVIMLDLRL